MRPIYRFATLILPLLASSLIVGCDPDPLRGYFVGQTPRDHYEAALKTAGLAHTALARDWLAAGERALVLATTVESPYQEVGYLDPADPRADAYRLDLRRGERLVARVDAESAEPAQFFVDLFVLSETRETRDPVLLATADTASRTLDYVTRRDGIYLLRIQPELLRGGRYSLSIDVSASLDFPVVGGDTRAIRSGFGAPRDAGRREHHGVDIFAPRGTPVLATSRGRVSWVGTTGLGGNVVWVRDGEMGYALYYAHLDRQAVSRGDVVQPGDTIGFVGNSGNARTTPPHLHFGIYVRGTGPVDPYPFLFRPDEMAPPLFANDRALGDFVRVSRDAVPLHAAPSPRAAAMTELSRHTVLKVLGAAGTWYRVSLPDGAAGFVAARLTELAARPIRFALVEDGSVVRELPLPDATPVDSVDGEVPVHGEFGRFVYVTTPRGRSGWVRVE